LQKSCSILLTTIAVAVSRQHRIASTAEECGRSAVTKMHPCVVLHRPVNVAAKLRSTASLAEPE
jgi:hypothetical protein